MSRRVLRPRQVQEKLGIGCTKLYELIKSDPNFPTKVRISERACGFFDDELDRWLEDRRENPRPVVC